MRTFKNEGQIKFLDAEFLLSSLWIDGELDEQSFHKFIAIPIQALKLKYGKVRAMGEMVDVLWKQSQHTSALQLENLWNELSHKQEFSLLCTYLLDNLDSNTYEESLEHICQCHTHLISPENDDSVLAVFGAAWNRVVGKLTDDSQKISTQIPPSPASL